MHHTAPSSRSPLLWAVGRCHLSGEPTGYGSQRELGLPSPHCGLDFALPLAQSHPSASPALRITSRAPAMSQLGNHMCSAPSYLASLLPPSHTTLLHRAYVLQGQSYLRTFALALLYHMEYSAPRELQATTKASGARI